MALHGEVLLVNLESIRDARSISSKMEMNIAVAVVATTMFALAAESAVASDDLIGDCRIGTYHLQDGNDVDIGATEGRICGGGAWTAPRES